MDAAVKDGDAVCMADLDKAWKVYDKYLTETEGMKRKDRPSFEVWLHRTYMRERLRK